MKNITITMEDEAADWVRIEAAKRNSSVSRMLGEMVAQQMQREDAYAVALKGWQDKKRTWRSDGSAYPSRESTYERT